MKKLLYLPLLLLVFTCNGQNNPNTFNVDMSYLDSSVIATSLQLNNPIFEDYNRYIVNSDYAIYYESETSRKIITVDSESFRYPKYDQSRFFALDKNGVYFKGNFVPVDTTGFTIVGTFRKIKSKEGRIVSQDPKEEYFWKTNTKIYIDTTEVKEDIDVASFRRAGGHSTYFKDKNCIYYRDKRIDKSDGSSASESFYEMIYDKNYVYIDGKIGLYEGDTLRPVNHALVKTKKVVLNRGNLKVQNGMDAKTIKPLSRKFSMDKNFVYFLNHKMSVPPSKFKNVKVWQTNNSAYLSDGNTLYKVYGDGEVVPKPELDAKTFGTFPIADHFFDKNGAYKWHYSEKEDKVVLKKMPFKYSDPVSLKNTSMTERSSAYVFYKNQVSDGDGTVLYENLTEEEIELVRSHKRILVKIGNSTKLATGLGYQLYKTEDKVYWNKKATSADVSTFEKVSSSYLFGSYYKDKNYIYRYEQEEGLTVIKDIDVNTLSVFNGFLADKDYVYAKEYRILRNEKVELLGIFRGYVPGCGLDETPASTYYLFKNIDGHWIVLVSGNSVKVNYIGVELDEKLKANINLENIVYPVDTGETYTATEVLPEYPEGLNKLNEFFDKNFKLPNLDRHLKGVVYLQFIVEKDGSLSDIKVLRELRHGTGEEAVRILKLAGKWNAGLQNGEPVRVKYTLPVRIDVEPKQE